MGQLPPDPAQTAEYLHTLRASYDDQSGTVTIQFSLYDPATWGPVLTNGDGGSGSGGNLLFAPLEFQLGYLGDPQHPATYPGDPTPQVFCNANGVPGVNQPQLGSPILGGSIVSVYNSNGSFAADTIDVTLEGYNGDVSAPVSFDGTTFTATVQNQAFQGHIWDCLVLNYFTELPMSPPAPPPSPNACSTYERDILNFAPNRIKAWHNMTCRAAKQVLRSSRIARRGNLRAPGFSCRVLRRYRVGKLITGASVRCTAPGKWFQLIWGT
jgi:hypothetical protein